MTTLHVAMNGADTADGSASGPLRTVSRAAELARPGDTVLVHEDEYRKWLRPRRGGLSDARRITYQAAPGEHVTVKGSEPVTGWQRDPGTGARGTGWRAVPDTNARWHPGPARTDGAAACGWRPNDTAS